MLQATTMPYVKKFDSNGVVINPISKHVWDGNNRQKRRELMQKARSFNNSNNCQQVVYKTYRCLKKVQIDYARDGSIKRINHLVFAN